MTKTDYPEFRKLTQFNYTKEEIAAFYEISSETFSKELEMNPNLLVALQDYGYRLGSKRNFTKRHVEIIFFYLGTPKDLDNE